MRCMRVATTWVSGKKKKKPLFFSCSNQKCMKLKKKMISKEEVQSFISYAKESNVFLFISFLWEVTRDRMLCL